MLLKICFQILQKKKKIGDGRGNKIHKTLSYWRGVMDTDGL